MLLALAAFIWLSSSALPEFVASHFGASGSANGFMHRGVYVGIMLGLVLGVPSLLAFLPEALAAQGSKSLNIPNRDYWLALSGARAQQRSSAGMVGCLQP